MRSEADIKRRLENTKENLNIVMSSDRLSEEVKEIASGHWGIEIKLLEWVLSETK